MAEHIRRNSFHLNKDSKTISIVFDHQVLPFIKGKDHAVLQMALGSDDTSCYLKQLSPELKDCLLAIGGAESADMLDVDPESCSMPFLDLSHHNRREIEFSLVPISKMPPWTTGKRKGKGTGDRIIIERLLGPPYLQGDHKAVNPKGALDFAVSAMLRDSVWLDAGVGLVSSEYPWSKLYLAETCCALIYKQVLGKTIRFGMGDDQRTYGETTDYKATASASFLALKEIGDPDNNSVAIAGPNRALLRPGMGVVIDPPLQERAQAANVESVFGSVTAIDTASGKVTCRLLLCRDNLPEYVLGGLGPNELVQTNALLEVPFDWVFGTFRLWPSQLFHAECIPQESEDNMRKKLLGRTVVCDMKIFPDDENSCSGGEDAIMVTFEIFPKLLQGRLRLRLSRMKPFPAHAALAYIFHIHELEGGLNPAAVAYRSLLGHALASFASLKAEHARSAKDQLSFRPDMPGLALMELLHRTVPPEDRIVAIRNGVMTVEVRKLDILLPVFGVTPTIFDLRSDGHGVIEFHGPFVFKWSMYDTTKPWGSLTGSLSISVGSFTEKNRMGTDVIKSSKCHPDALRGSGIKPPAEKKARTSKASSDTGRTKQASKAPEQAIERMQRRARRLALLAGGSGSESTSSSDKREVSRSSSQSSYCSDSQSGGEGSAAAAAPA